MDLTISAYSATSSNTTYKRDNQYQDTKSANTIPLMNFSSPLDQLAHLFINTFDTRIDTSERATTLVLQLQELVRRGEYDFIDTFLSHDQAKRLHPSIMLGALFITENITQVKESWDKLDLILRSKIKHS